MVKITEELVRKKSEHNESIINSLEELSLHQEDVEKIENLNNWCRDLQILLLQANLISKIENLNKLKKLQYLNLALNNIEKIENLSRCESLEKLDLTLNFIGDLESVASLKNNENLKELYLTGNPCSYYEGYRNYVIATLPQLESLDNVKITRSERIKALQEYEMVKKVVIEEQQKYQKTREEQKERLSRVNFNDVSDEEFWKTKSENAPEVRIEIAKRSRKCKGLDVEVDNTKKPAVRLYTKDGRPLNVNQAKMDFKFCDDDPKEYVLDVAVYKYLDTNLIEVDLQPILVKVTIKGKVFQFVLPEEIHTDRSTAERSQTTGHLVIKMPRVNYKPLTCYKKGDKKDKKQNDEESLKNVSQNSGENHNRTREFLDVIDKNDEMDFSNIVKQCDPKKMYEDIPPLEYPY